VSIITSLLGVSCRAKKLKEIRKVESEIYLHSPARVN
jgi:hypothetical protein